MTRNRVVLFALVALAVCAGFVWAQDAGSATISAVYKTSQVQEGSSSFSMTFAVRMFNLSDNDIQIDRVKLANPSNTSTYATWDSVTVPANGKVELSDDVEVGKQEYKRWKSGAPAVLYTVTRNNAGDAVATQVQATYQPSGW